MDQQVGAQLLFFGGNARDPQPLDGHEARQPEEGVEECEELLLRAFHIQLNVRNNHNDKNIEIAGNRKCYPCCYTFSNELVFGGKCFFFNAFL